jgi:gluconokinase
MSGVLDEVLEGFEPSPQFVSVMAGSRTAALLALDVGTSSVRASLFDMRGCEVEDASVRLQQTRSGFPDFALMDAEAVFTLVVQTIDVLLEKPVLASMRIELIAISCFWHSLMGIDADGVPTTRLSTWADGRAVREVKELKVRFNEAEMHSRTGCSFHTSYWPAKLLWLKHEQAESFNATTRWLSFGEYVGLRLFGEIATSLSMASGTGLMNIRSCEWDAEFIRALDIPRESLPEISSQHQTFQHLTDEYVSRWPQLSEARLFPVIADGAANSIGSGCTTPEKLALMVGTSGAMRLMHSGPPPTVIPPALWCYRADRERVILGGALSDGGGLYAWIRDSLLGSYDWRSIEGYLEALEPDAHGLTVLPFWAGERSTGWSTDARGAILGLTMSTQPIEILRAAMEAIAYRFALITKALEPFAAGAAIIASGTALESSSVWAQMLADVLGRPLSLSGASEASTRGAALLALEATGKIQGIETFEVRIARTFEPDMARHVRYRKGLERQQQIYERVMRVN